MRQSGLTLIELLIAVAISSLIIVLTYSILVKPGSWTIRVHTEADIQEEIVSGMETLVELLRGAVSVAMRAEFANGANVQATGPTKFFIVTNQTFRNFSSSGGEFMQPPSTFQVQDVGQVIVHSAAIAHTTGIADIPTNRESIDTTPLRIWLVDFREDRPGTASPCPSGMLSALTTGCFRICSVPHMDAFQTCFAPPDNAPPADSVVLGTFRGIEELAFELLHSECDHVTDPSNPGIRASTIWASNIDCRSTDTNGNLHTAFFPPLITNGSAYGGPFERPSSNTDSNNGGSMGDDLEQEISLKDLNTVEYALSEIFVRIRMIGEVRDSKGRVDLSDPNIGNSDRQISLRPFLQTGVYLRNFANRDSFLQTLVQGPQGNVP